MTTIYNSIRWKFIFGLNETTAATFADRLWPDAIAVRSSYQLSPTSALIYSEWNRSLRSRRHSCTCSINLHYHNILYVEWSHFSRGGLACYLSRVHCIRRGRLSWVAAAHAINNIIIVIQVLTQGTLRTPRSDLEWLYKCQRRSFIGTRLIDPHIGHIVEIDRVFVESKNHLSHDFVNEKLSE